MLEVSLLCLTHYILLTNINISVQQDEHGRLGETGEAAVRFKHSHQMNARAAVNSYTRVSIER